MSEKRILLASLLKPVNDTRMFEKLGLSLCRLPNVQVHIAGYSAPTPSDLPRNLTLHPAFNFKRLSIGRARAQIKYWKLLKAVKPDLIIVCTHELLLFSVLYRKKYNCRIIYDVQENYTLNLLSQQYYHRGVKQLLAGGVSFIEKYAASNTDHFLLAEKSYADELTFLGSNYTLLENKFKARKNYEVPNTPVQLQTQSIKLLYTGTIAPLYGVFEAVDLAASMYEFYPGTTLTIMGYSSSDETLTKLRKAISDKPYIMLVGGDKLVPHYHILEAIKTSDIGLMPYHTHESIRKCIPTKLFEYVACGLPLLIEHNPVWDNLVKKYDCGLSINYNAIDINELLQALFKYRFYRQGIPDDVFWEPEEQKLNNLIGEFIS